MVGVQFENDEYYHIYNRGVDKRNIVGDTKDRERFLLSMQLFNAENPIGSIFENAFKKKAVQSDKRLVDFVAFCLNPNHFHFILCQKKDRGIIKFMHRLSTGYTKYFNERYDRSGALFEGRFKRIHIKNNDYLLRLSAYVNLNYRVHGLGRSTSKSSWVEYLVSSPGTGFCERSIILEQFENNEEYRIFAEETVKDIRERRLEDDSIPKLLLEEVLGS